MIFRLVILTVFLLYVLAALLLLIFFVVHDKQIQEISNPVFITLLLFLSATIIMIWRLFSRQLLISDSVLIINDEGIQIGKLPQILDEIFIAWSEIDGIYPLKHFYTGYLCINPKNMQEYSYHMNLLKKVIMRANLLLIGGAICIPQSVMVEYPENILEQICLCFAHKIEKYDIDALNLLKHRDE